MPPRLTATISRPYHRFRFIHVPAKSYFNSCRKRGDTSTGKYVNTVNDFSKLDSRIEGLHRTNSFLRSTREGPQKAEDKNRKHLPADGSGFAAHPRRVWSDIRRRQKGNAAPRLRLHQRGTGNTFSGRCR